jgi:micrococcal nuclease
MSDTEKKSAHPWAKSIASRWGLLGVIIVLIASLYQADQSGIVDLNLSATSTESLGTYYKVTKVTDGDTLHIDMNGTNETLRLIGINTPETVDPRKTVECFGKEASVRMKELASGKIVRLEYDDTQGTRDVYGRLLAYVYLEDGEMINRKMIAEGYAYEYTYMTPYKYQKEFRNLQSIAKTSERGLWAPNSCNGKK